MDESMLVLNLEAIKIAAGERLFAMQGHDIVVHNGVVVRPVAKKKLAPS